MLSRSVPIILFMWFCCDGFAVGQAQYVANRAEAGSFPIVQNKRAATLWVDAADWPGVIRAVGDLRSDVARVTGIDAPISNNADNLKRHAIIIGTIGRIGGESAFDFLLALGTRGGPVGKACSEAIDSMDRKVSQQT